jgi:microcin C transport system ATP-binding protein
LITHDLGVVRKFADRLAVMTDGEIVEMGATDTVLENPQHPYTQHLLASAPSGRAIAAVDAPVLLKTNDLKVHFPIMGGFFRKPVDYVRAVDGISLQVQAGHTLGVVGESGSGKTTLGMALLRLISSTGDIDYNGQDISNKSFAEMRPLRHEMQIVFQDPFGSLSPRMSVGQIVEEGLLVHEPKLDSAARADRVTAALTEVGLDPETRHRFPHEFSGGQRQRISIARALVLNPRFVVLDEPTSALDLSVQAQIVDLLRDLQEKRNLAYLFISHDLRVVRALSHEVVVMKDGKMVEFGTADQIFEDPKTDYARALIAASFNLEATHQHAVSG